MNTVKIFSPILPVICISALTACTGESDPSEITKRPNIILIMADDMGFSEADCYGWEISTPNLDSLAYHGLRFIN